MSSHIKLKPCPFCGGEAQLLMVGKRPNGDEEWYVSCSSEDCSLYPHSTVPYVSAEIAAKAWNRRADNTRSAPVGDVAALREALTKVSEWMAHRIATGGFEASPTFPTVLENIVLPALAKPPRNCDVYDAKTAEKEFVRQTGSKSIRSKSVRWLYAPHNSEEVDGR